MSRALLVCAALAAVAGAAPALAGQSVRARLQGRVPDAALDPVDSIARAASAAGLPVDPIVQKALEGGAKRAKPARIVKATAQVADQLREARDVLARDTTAPPPAEIEAVAAALGRGLPRKLARRIRSALPDEPTGPALHAVADLVGHGFPQDSAVDLVVAGARKGLRGMRLLDVAAAAVHELQRGRSPEEAMATVRDELPAVPTPPVLSPANVTRLRRPPADSERR